MVKNNFKNKMITARDKDFAKWYTDVCLNAKLCDYGPVKGTIVFKPWGYAIWENIQRIFNFNFQKLGVENVYFPALIPKSLIAKEADHVEGFVHEFATVTKVGNKKLEEDLYLRPTSEVLICNQFAKDVKSYRDLPLKYNQWCNVFRWEKSTRPFLRTSEFMWQEGHTIHALSSEAREFALTIFNLYNDVLTEELNLATLTGKKTEKEKFAGAIETFTVESLMYDGQALQCATSHYFGDEFSKAFGITFEDQDQKVQHAFSTSWGISTRLIGAIIMAHGDDNGLILPFNISPSQIDIIPINDSDVVKKACFSLDEKLKKHYRTRIINTDKSAGFRIAKSEIQGVPLRLEIGPRDIASKKITIAIRDNYEKIITSEQELETTISKLVIDYKKRLSQRTSDNLRTRIININTFKEYSELIESKNIIALVPFCCKVDCETFVKEHTRTNSRCISSKKLSSSIKCFACDSPAKSYVYFARAY